MDFQRKTKWALLAVAAAALSACGGGGSDTTPVAPITGVKVMGDSLADSGTFGLKFTVQGAAPTGAGSTPIWPERIASEYGVSLCPKYQFTGTTFNAAAPTTPSAAGASTTSLRRPRPSPSPSKWVMQARPVSRPVTWC